MTTKENMRIFASRFVSLTDEEFNFFCGFFEEKQFKKKDILTREGEIATYFYFIEQGAARLFFQKGKDEVVMEIVLENEPICCYDSWLTKKPSNFSIEAIEPLIVFCLKQEDLETIFAYSPKFERLGRLFARDEYLRKAEFDYNRVRVSTEQRFIEFMKNNGPLIQRVPQKYLASYLNIKPETFSRLKHLVKRVTSRSY